MWLQLAILACASCGRIDFELERIADGAIGDGRIGDTTGDACVQSAWSAPVTLASVNSAGTDWEPALRPDGKMLAFGRDDGATTQIFVAVGGLSTGFSPPGMVLANVNSNSGPTWSPAGDQLFFVSDRILKNDFHLYISKFDVTNTTSGAPDEVNELASQSVNGPTLSSTGLELFYNDGSGNGSKIRHAVRASLGTPWQDLGYVDALNSGTDGWPSLSPDDLTIYWESTRVNSLGSIFQASRPAVGAPFGTPMEVPGISGSDADGGDPDISPDGLTMLFDSTRGGNYDIYVATRSNFCP
jgi:Tol biopolymer transport system component